MKDIVSSVYRFRLEPINSNYYHLIPVAKVGNHSVLNQVFKDESQVKRIGPLPDLEGVSTFIFYQNPQNSASILNQMVLNVCEHNHGYARFEKCIQDAAVARIKDDYFELIVSNGNCNFSLQIFHLLKDGCLDEEIEALWEHLG